MAPADSTRPPAFQFYPNDFLSDAHVVVMSLQERGAYITLLCLCWQQGSLPSDVAHLARLCGVPPTVFRRLWPALQPCFREGEPGRLVQPRLEREREKQAVFRRRQTDAANKRWQSHGNATASTPACAEPMPRESQRNALQSSSSSSSSDCSHKSTRAREPRPSEVPEELAERAGRFLERYGELYAQHRRGARYLSRPSLDFQEALGLVATWDDARLEKLATVFLTTDHEFAEKGSRTMAQFRVLASWCDGKLREAGL